MFALGHKRTIDPVRVMSDLLPRADTRRCRLNACYGPIAESVLQSVLGTACGASSQVVPEPWGRGPSDHFLGPVLGRVIDRRM
jgi:hypothetical protein